MKGSCFIGENCPRLRHAVKGDAWATAGLVVHEDKNRIVQSLLNGKRLQTMFLSRLRKLAPVVIWALAPLDTFIFTLFFAKRGQNSERDTLRGSANPDLPSPYQTRPAAIVPMPWIQNNDIGQTIEFALKKDDAVESSAPEALRHSKS